MHSTPCVLNCFDKTSKYICIYYICISPRKNACNIDGLVQERRNSIVKARDGLVQERRNSISNALELRLSCTIIKWQLFPFSYQCWLLSRLYNTARCHHSVVNFRQNPHRVRGHPQYLALTWYHQPTSHYLSKWLSLTFWGQPLPEPMLTQIYVTIEHD